MLIQNAIKESLSRRSLLGSSLSKRLSSPNTVRNSNQFEDKIFVTQINDNISQPDIR